MTIQHVRDYSSLCTDEATIRNTERAIAAYRASGNKEDLQVRNPWFKATVRGFKLPIGDYTDDELEIA